MKRLKYILTMILLAVAALAAEGQTYVIDSVCMGAERNYRRDGEKNNFYDWYIIDKLSSDTFGVPGIDYTEINGTDTTWGNEISYLWDAVGEFDMLVYVTTEHGCDTAEQGMVKVFDLPIAQAGADRVLCSFEDYQLTNDSAWNYSVIYWSTTGDGVFSDPYSFHPVYSFGATDSLLGTVTLYLTAEGLADNGTCEPDIDSLVIDVSSPDIVLEPFDPLCFNDSSGYITTTIVGGMPPYQYEWKGPAGFVSVNADSIGGLWAGMYILTVTDDNGCTDTDSVELFYPPELLLTIDSVQNISCYGYSDGAIYASASGGTGTIQFLWEGLLGSTYTAEDILNIPADTYIVTATDENGCSKVETVILPQPDSILAMIDVSDSLICEGETTLLTGTTLGGTGSFTYQWSGSGALFLDADTTKDVVFENAPEGDYLLVFTITDEANCEASDSISITVYPPTYSYDSLEVCAGTPSFEWNHRTVTSDMDRIYTDTLIGANQYGCDSILTLDVKVLFPEYYEDTIYVCENDVPYEPYGNITIYPDHDSIYLDTVRYTSSGCDSLLITISVFSLPVTDTLLDSTLCAGAPEFMWNNRWIQTDSSQVYLDTLVNSYGCDSLLTYDITILPPDTFYVDTTFCQDEPEFVWNGITILTAFDSIYEATLTNSFGCDSIVNLNVQLLPVTDTTIDTLLCYNTPPFAWNNLVIFAEHDSTYLDTLVNSYGCDSLLTLNVTVIYPDTVNMDTSMCEGVPEFVWNSHTVNTFTDSIYTEYLQNQYGCDSIVNLDVRILLPYDSMQTVELCANETPYDWYGHTIMPDRDSMYYDTLYYAAGCDSLRLQLEIISLPVSDTLLDITLCEGSPEFTWNSHTISTFADSTYLDTLSNMYGCDSTITLNVHIVPAFKDTSQLVICYGEPVAPWYGQAISSESDSVYMQTLPDPLGCDTLLYYEVTVRPIPEIVLDSTLCAGLPDFMWNNRLISTTRDSVYLDTLQSSFGCDSLLTYNITILPPDTFSTDTLLCYGDPEFVWNGQNISTSVESDYQATLTNLAGCDSVVILNVKLLDGTTRDTFISVCEDYTWTDGTGITYTTSGTYLHSMGNTACADSVWLHLTISPSLILDTVVDPVLCYGDSSGTITLLVSGGTAPYHISWNTGDTTDVLNNLPAGNYHVLVSDALNCTAELEIEITQPLELQLALDALTDVAVAGESTGSIEVSVSGGTPVYSYEWTNAAGITVGTGEDLYNLPAGDYTLTLTDANGCIVSDTYTITEPERTICLDDTTFACYEDLATYPMIASLEDYVALLQPGQTIDPGCGIDTSSFTSISTVDAGSIYCYEEIRFYALLDDCGDTIFSCEQHVIVNDTEAPIISCPPDITVINDVIPDAYADASEFIAAGGTIDDNCGVVSFRLVGGTVSLGGSDPARYQRTYEVEDYCGNTRQCTQIIEVYLNSDFTIDCTGLPNVTYDCVGSLPKYTLQSFRDDGGYAFSYPYDIVDFSYTDVSDGKRCPETVTRTFRIENENGDVETCTVVYRVVDDIAPTLILPDKYIACTENWPAYNTYNDVLKYRNSHGNDAFDNCGNSSIQYISLLSNKKVETCPTVYERVYEIADWCGNSSETTERIIVEEQPLEFVSAPKPLNSDCLAPAPYSTIAEFEADGGKVNVYCGAKLTFEHVSDVSAGAAEPGVVYRTYRFWDTCDSIDVVQKITIIDIVPPVLTCPPADTLALGESFPYNAFASLDEFLNAGGFAEDNCTLDSTSLTLVRKDSVVEDCEKQVTYTFIISDLSGNWSVECDHTIYQIDQADPQLFCPPGTTVQCMSDIPEPYSDFAEFEAAGGSATDDYELDITSFRLLSEVAGNTACPRIVTRTYSIEDLCGNMATCEQYITVSDTIPPSIVCPPGDTAECLSATVAYNRTLDEFIANGGFVDDNCEIDPTSFTFNRTTTKLLNSTEITIVYSIADLCGNVSSCTQSVVLTDSIPPDAVCNEITVYLDADGNYLMTEIDMTNISAGSSDNCTAAEDLIIDVIPEEVTCEDVEFGKDVIVVVTDEAGNSANCDAHVNVVDTIPPVALCKPATIYLDESGQAHITVDMINDDSYDNCTDVSLSLSKFDFDCENLGDNTVTLIVTDEYGMTSTCEATVTVLDTISPQISCVPGDTIQLGADGTFTLTYEMINNSEWENCEIVTRELDRYILDCDNIGMTEITAIATDQSGNVGTCTTSFVIIGNTPPNVQNDSAVTAINIPVDINVVLNDYDLKTNINLSTLGIINGPSHGKVSVDNKTGIVTYTPNNGYVGEDIFRYTICDDGIPCEPECGEAIVFVTVRPANQPPVALDDYFDLPCGELTGNVKLNDSDPDGDQVFVDLVLLTQPVNGIAIMLDEYGNFEYSPNYDFTEGVDSFQYIIHDNGIPSLADTAWAYITRVADHDCDGVADVDDIDDDNDGIRDNIENGGFWPEDPGAVLLDSDQDGIPDYFDIDSDNDGIVDNIEGQGEHDYIAPDGWRDDNHNGWDDRYDDEEGGNAFDLYLTDTDGDGTPDYLDSDSDNDGVYDFIEGNDEIGPNFIGDGIPDYIRFYTDLDRDGLDDAYDWVESWGDLVDNEIGSLSPLQDSDNDGTRDWRDVNDEDDQYLTHNEDINGDGDYSNDDLDLDGTPEYLDTEMECDLFIPEGFSPNDDGVHDFFQILCIYPRYPNAKLMIFNRNGQKLFEKENYGNYDVWGWNDAWWWGNSENRFTIGRAGGLPAGNYIYVLELNDGLGGVRNGTVMIAY